MNLVIFFNCCLIFISTADLYSCHLKQGLITKAVECIFNNCLLKFFFFFFFKLALLLCHLLLLPLFVCLRWTFTNIILVILYSLGVEHCSNVFLFHLFYNKWWIQSWKSVTHGNPFFSISLQYLKIAFLYCLLSLVKKQHLHWFK